MDFEYVREMAQSEFDSFLSHPDWVRPSFARKITGYEDDAFYKVLRQKVNGKQLIINFESRVPLQQPMKFVYLPSLLNFIRMDLPRVEKEFKSWEKKLNAQKENLPKLQGRYPNA